MLIEVLHETHYHFDRPVSYALQRLRLRPKNGQGQTVREWDMEVVNGLLQVEFEDHHTNTCDLVTVNRGAEELIVRCRGIIETSGEYHGVNGRHRGFIPMWKFAQPTAITKNAAGVNALAKQARDLNADNPIALLHGLSNLIREEVEYALGVTDVTTTAEQSLTLGKGVCQDHAHIFISAARVLGYPARYVSGYLHMSDRTEQQAGHAWAEAWVEGVGWIGFDISNGISPDEHYVRVATGFDYSDAAPITSLSFGATDSNMDVRLKIEQRPQQ